MSDTLGQDQFQPVNRRAGYGDALEMALSAARKGWTLSAGQGALIVEHYEEKLAAARTVVEAAVKFVDALNSNDFYVSYYGETVAANLRAAVAKAQEDA